MLCFRRILAAAAAVACLFAARPAAAYVEIPYSLGRLVSESTHVVLMRVERVDKERNIILYTKVQDIKGKHPEETIRHNIGRSGFHPREWQTVMNWAEVGKTAVFMHNGGASETCIDKYWYQAYPGGGWWSMSHAEPYLNRSFAGRPEKLAQAVADMVAGREVVVPCMEDGDKNALALGTARIQRLRASMELMDYNPRRDFVGWGGDDFRRLAGMKGFSQAAEVGRVDPGARGVKIRDFDGDGAADFLVYGETGVALMQVAGSALNQVSLPYAGGARSAEWGDYNGDGKPDLLLATDSGPRLFTNTGDGFADDSGGIPREPYYNNTAAAWIDYDGDGRPDILLSNGFLGLRLYRNLGPDAPKEPLAPSVSPWYYAGPFDNSNARGFDTAYPPEHGVDLEAKYTGKGGEPVQWREGKFTDGQVNDLQPLFKPQHQNDACVYLYRQFNFGGAAQLPISLGSDDTLTVWLNGERILAENVYRGCAPDQHLLTLNLRAGRNELLLKVCQGSGEWAYYFGMKEELPKAVPPLFADISTQVSLGPDGLCGRERAEHLLVADFTGNGRPDVLCGAGKGKLLTITPQGFTELREAGISYSPAYAAPLVADIDGDGKIDVLVFHQRGVRLWRNQGEGRFADETPRLGELAKPIAGLAGGTWFDFDGDGQGDLLLGRLRGTNLYFRNTGEGKFVNSTSSLGLQQRIYNTRAIAVGDLNKSGSPDLVLANEGQQSVVLLGAAADNVAAAP